jgi:hypothetical protein
MMLPHGHFPIGSLHAAIVYPARPGFNRPDRDVLAMIGRGLVRG